MASARLTSHDVGVKWQVVLAGSGCRRLARLENFKCLAPAQDVDGWESLLFSLNSAGIKTLSIITMATLSRQKLTNKHVIEGEIVGVTLSAGATALCFFLFFSCLLLAPDREGKKKKKAEWFLSGGEKPAGWRASRWQRQFAVWLNPHQRSQAVKKAATHCAGGQTDAGTRWHLMSRSYLAGERTAVWMPACGNASKNGRRNANKATLHLLGTLAQIRCE